MVEKAKYVSFRSDTVLTPQNAPQGPWRAAHLFVHKKRTKRANGSDLATPRYDAVILAPKLGTAETCPNYAFLVRLVHEAATRAGWLGNGQWPTGMHWPIQDGDIPYAVKPPAPGQQATPVDPNKNKWREGYWQVEVTNYTEAGPRVAILQNGQKQDIPAQTFNGRTYYKSGDFAVTSMHAWTFHNEKFGVNFGFDGLIFVAEGEAIGSSGGPKSTATMFADVTGAGMPAQSSPAVGAPPGPPSNVVPFQPVAAPPPGYAPPPMPPAAAPVYAAPAPAAYTPPGPPTMGPPPGAPALPPFPR